MPRSGPIFLQLADCEKELEEASPYFEGGVELLAELLVDVLDVLVLLRSHIHAD